MLAYTAVGNVFVWIVWITAAAACLGTGVLVVTRTNPFHSALALIGNLGSLAVLYLLLSAEFVAAAQILVYAGAVMVMFLFVIAYLGGKADAPWIGGRPRPPTVAADLPFSATYPVLSGAPVPGLPVTVPPLRPYVVAVSVLPVIAPLLMLKILTVSVPLSVSVPPDTVTVAPSARRLALPKVSVPAVTLTAVAADVPFKATVPELLSVPVPRLPVTVPPLRPYVVAVSVLPVIAPLLMLKMLTVSVPLSVSVPPETVTVAPSARRSELPKVSVPAVTLTEVAADVPFRATVPELFSVPVPRLPVTVPPLRP